MKKSISRVLAGALVLVFFQNAYAGGFGIKVGVNFAYISDVEPVSGLDLGRNLGLILGAFYRIDLGETFAIQPEVYYSQKGIKATGSFNGGEIIGKDVLDYVEIPVLMKFKIPTEGNLLPSVFIGPYVSFLMSAKEKAEWDGQSDEVDIKDDLNTTDFGLCFGVNIDYDIGHSRIVIDARYSLGLKKIPWEVDEPDNKNSVFTLMLGYAFN